MLEIELRYVTSSDLPILFEFQREPEGNAMAALPARDLHDFMAHWRKILNEPACTLMAVTVNGSVAGNIGSWSQDDKRLVGYWLGKQFWGQGIATVALSKFIGQWCDRPLYAYAAKHNAGSIRVLEKCGFVLVGEDDDEKLFMLER